MPIPLAARGVAWLTRNFHQLPGRWRLVRWLDQHEDLLASLPPQTVQFAGEYRMHVNPLDENGRRVFVHGFDPRERLTRHFIRLVRPGDCVIDIGANVGYYAVVSAKLVGPRGCVHAFEASQQTFKWLETNAALNPVANIHVHRLAVTDRCGEIEFYSAPPEKTGYSSIRDLGDDSTRVETVPTVSLDSMLDDLPPIRLVKIDVEGAELLVLRGMRGLIERDQPFFLVEIDDTFLRELGFSAEQQCDFLRDAGYELHRIVEAGALEPVKGAPSDRCNLLATPRTPEGLAAARV